MILTAEENEEVVGILQQKELDLRTEIRNLDPLDGAEMVAKWALELDARAARIRELWKIMQLS